MKTLSTYKITLAALALFLSALMFSCQKEELSNANSSVSEEDAASYSDESAKAEASFDDAEDISMTAADEESAVSAPLGRPEEGGNPIVVSFEELRLRIGHCATVTVEPNNDTYPKTITIDFKEGCLCADGKYRKGAIVIHLTGPIRRSGSVMTITFREFYLNRVHIEGTKTVSNLSEEGHVKFTVQVTGGKVTFPNGRGYKYEALKYVKQLEGSTTHTVRDNVYSIEGRSKTEFNNGLTVTLNTESPLIKKVSCPWISSGLLKIRINDRTLFLNYAAPNEGDCDNKALLTWNDGNKERLITLP